jgi:hypothetical protein
VSRPRLHERVLRELTEDRFQNPWDTGAPSEFGTPTEIVEIGSGGPGTNYMLAAAEVAPVQKAPQSQTNFGHNQDIQQTDGMDIDGITA